MILLLVLTLAWLRRAGGGQRRTLGAVAIGGNAGDATVHSHRR
jgi:hypothetical protein